jgi:hypothetical protein
VIRWTPRISIRNRSDPCTRLNATIEYSPNGGRNYRIVFSGPSTGRAMLGIGLSIATLCICIVDLIAGDDKVVAHFRCSGTHRGEWLGLPATGRRFERVDEIYIFEVRDSKLVSAVGVEDNLNRMRQLGIVHRPE